jgi:hypothetical protein
MISGLYGKEEKPSAKSGLSSAAGGVFLFYTRTPCCGFGSGSDGSVINWIPGSRSVPVILNYESVSDPYPQYPIY